MTLVMTLIQSHRKSRHPSKSKLETNFSSIEMDGQTQIRLFVLKRQRYAI